MIIENLSNEEYHRGEKYLEYLSSTQLKDYEISPKFARYKKLSPDEFSISKEASIKGSLYHNCLESIVKTGSTDAFKETVFIFEPPVNKNTGKPYGYDSKIYQESLFLAQEQNPDKEFVSKDDFLLVLKMIDELLNGCRQTSKDIRQIIKWGKAETSHFIEYEGCKFKFRPDLETAKKIVDWKTIAADDLHEQTIAKIISKFKYDISAAFYQFFSFIETGDWKDFYWVFQQKSAPFDAVLVSAENWAYSVDNGIVKMGHGAHKFKTLLDQHIYCELNNDYDGAQCFINPDYRGRRIMTPEAPNYEKMKSITFFN